MKQNKITNFWAVAILCFVSLFASCAKDDVSTDTPQTTPESVTKPTTYTVMLYGCAGSSLDGALNYNLKQLEAAGKKSRVNFRALVKYSAGTNQEKHPGTTLITMTEDKGLTEVQAHDANYRLDNPAHLTEFIKETKEKMPADKYVLVIWNHGDVFGPDDGPVEDSYPENGAKARGAIYDDNISDRPGLSTLALEKAIKDTGDKIDLVYFDVCLMGMVETYTQLKDVAHYAMGAINLTPGEGGNYAQLVNSLQENDSIEDAIKAYIPGVISDWKAGETSFHDLSCFDLTYMDELNTHIKTATDELIRWQNELRTPDAEEGTDDFDAMQNYLYWHYRCTEVFPEKNVFAPLINNERNSSPKDVEESYAGNGAACSTDLVTALKRCALTSSYKFDGALSGYATLIDNTLKKMTVATGCVNPPSTMNGVSMGITWPCKLTLRKMDLDAKYLSNLEGSAFNKATGWVNFLKQQEMDDYTIWTENTLFDNDIFFYWGNEKELEQKPTYYWTAKISVTDENVSQDISDVIEEAETEVNNKIANATFPLFHGRGLAQHIYHWLQREYYYSRFRHVKISVSLVDGQDGQLSDDEDNAKYPHTVEKSFVMY